MKAQRVVLFLSLVLLLGSAAACAGSAPTPQAEVPNPAPSPTVAPVDQAPEASPQPSATDVTEVGATSQPAPGVSPTAPGAAAVTRIQFKSGATEAVAGGHLAAGGSARYVLAAGAGQTMQVSLSPDQGQAMLVIWGADGTVLMSDHAGSAYWTGTLPSTQDYYIDVRPAPGVAVDYSLDVVIPARIQFAPGATSASVQGTLGAGARHSYVLQANAGQTMTVRLTPADTQAYLIIWGADGSVLKSGAGEGKEWSGVLTISEDYYIEVRAAAEGPAVAYTLQVTILPAGSDGEPQATRITFPVGGTSATVKDSVPPAGAKRYVLKAMAGQTMTVDLMYPGGPALLVIWGADGTVLISDHAEAQQWSGTLPRTQDYYIDVRAAADGPTVAYTLVVTIPPAGSDGEPQATRIMFPVGGTSATVEGSVSPGAVKRYVLGAMAGQTMTVRLTPSDAQAYLVIWGADGSVLLSGTWQAKEWSGVLTISEDYYIDVQASGSVAVAFSLKVEIPPR